MARPVRSTLHTALALVGCSTILLAACGDDGSTTGAGGDSATGSTTTTSTTSTTGDTTTTSTASGDGGRGGAGGEGGGTTGAGGEGGAGPTFCEPGATEPCYGGPEGTEGVGLCAAGVATCLPDGSAFGACEGEVLPSDETCLTAGDDDCDGEVAEEGEGCDCVPGTVVDCYSGPPGSEGVGVCIRGEQTCNEDGLGYGPCLGEVTPGVETCATPDDDDCDGEVNEDGAGCLCVPGSTSPCYSGPDGTAGVGVCVAGLQTCNEQGTAYGACVGEVLPSTETCESGGDEDCDGLANEEGAGCACVPGTIVDCYSGPPGTQDVGSCLAGEQECLPTGLGYGACVGEVTPVDETCNTPDDDDCDGAINEGGAGCVCTPFSVASCYSGPAGTQGVGQCAAGARTCNAQGTAYGPCVGEVLPAAETCATGGDEDCDGLANEEGASCVCVPGATRSCYSGPAGTAGVGACAAGVQTCTPDGIGWGPCNGQTTPVAEQCATAVDDDCDGQANEGCSLTRWSEGTTAWPDQACNPNNSFGFCNTNAQNHADAWATRVCTNNGYTSGIWTGNKVGGCSGPISMWCQGAIPCDELYETSCAQGDQTRVEVTCFQ